MSFLIFDVNAIAFIIVIKHSKDKIVNGFILITRSSSVLAIVLKIDCRILSNQNIMDNDENHLLMTMPEVTFDLEITKTQSKNSFKDRMRQLFEPFKIRFTTLICILQSWTADNCFRQS